MWIAKKKIIPNKLRNVASDVKIRERLVSSGLIKPGVKNFNYKLKDSKGKGN